MLIFRQSQRWGFDTEESDGRRDASRGYSKNNIGQYWAYFGLWMHIDIPVYGNVPCSEYYNEIVSGQLQAFKNSILNELPYVT